MIKFTEVKPDILDIKSGQLFTPDGFLKTPDYFKKEEVNPLETEIAFLKQKGYNLDEVNQGINNDNSIQDKISARELANNIYTGVKQLKETIDLTGKSNPQ